MNRKLTPGGPYPFELFFEQGEIERICEEALKNSNLMPPAPQPVRIERFLDKRFPSAQRTTTIGSGVQLNDWL